MTAPQNPTTQTFPLAVFLSVLSGIRPDPTISIQACCDLISSVMGTPIPEADYSVARRIFAGFFSSDLFFSGDFDDPTAALPIRFKRNYTSEQHSFSQNDESIFFDQYNISLIRDGIDLRYTLAQLGICFRDSISPTITFQTHQEQAWFQSLLKESLVDKKIHIPFHADTNATVLGNLIFACNIAVALSQFQKDQTFTIHVAGRECLNNCTFLVTAASNPDDLFDKFQSVQANADKLEEPFTITD